MTKGAKLPVAESITLGLRIDKVFVPTPNGGAAPRFRVTVYPVGEGRYDSERTRIQVEEPYMRQWAADEVAALDVVAAALPDIRDAIRAVEVAAMVEDDD